MGDIWIWVIVAIVAFVVAPAIGGAFYSNQRAAHFASMGDVAGKPISEIVQAVGKPNAVTASKDGNTAYQWLDRVGHSMTHHVIMVDPSGKALWYSHKGQF